MAIEFERKYLVSSPNWQQMITSSHQIAQGYLAVTPLASIRVRLADHSATLTVKSSKFEGIGRIEVEAEINASDAGKLLTELAAGVVEKVRYALSNRPYQWTVDVFAGANEGLVLLEVEHTDQFELSDPPDWVGIEVTQDERFQNSYLSQHPFSQWGESSPLFNETTESP